MTTMGKRKSNYYSSTRMKTVAPDVKMGFLSLPDLVKLHICSFLDVSSLLNLRLVNKGMKGMVGGTTVVERLPIKIRKAKQMLRVLESSTAFNYFILSFKVLEEQSHLNEFLDYYGPGIRRLNITTFMTRAGHEKAVRLLAKCPSLRELEMGCLDTVIYERADDTFKCMLQNICQLRRLTIHEFEERSQNANGMKTVAFFLKLLNNCKNLEEFKVPVINSYNRKLETRQRRPVQIQLEERQVPVGDADEEDWEQETDNQEYDPIPEWDAQDGRDILLHPIMEYIKIKDKLKCTPLKRINVRSIVLFECNTFKDLLHVCKENGICLVGVQSSQFAYDDAWALNPDLNNVIQTAHLSSIRPGMPVSLFENVTELGVIVNPGYHYQGLSTKSDFTLPQLENLRVQFMFGVSDNESQLLIRRIFKDYNRSTVKKLQVEWLLDKYCTTISPKDLVVNFGYLTQLEIHAWTAVDTDFSLLWEKLPDLEKITIKDCKNITNKAFVGNHNLKDYRNIHERPLNRLKKLKSLTIRDITGNVNNVAIMDSFRWIKLRCFEFESTVISTIPEEVYRALMDAPFGRTVEYFVGPRPISRSFIFDERAFMLGFRNLKRRVFW